MSKTLSSFEELQSLLDAQLDIGYALCQPGGVRYSRDRTIATRYYRCVTNGETKAASNKKRSICKLGAGTCDAGFIAKYSVDTDRRPYGAVVLSAMKLDHPHPPTFIGQRVPQKTKQEISLQLQQGMDPMRIASDFRADLCHKNRAQLTLTRVHYLKNSYFKAQHRLLLAKEIELDKNDFKSVALSVPERWKDWVIRYHPLGHEGDGLKPETFCLIIASTFQREMLRECGTSMDIVFFDGTHNVVRYKNYYLFTLMVLDGSAQGCPAAWMLTNSKDATVQAFFLQALKDAVPEFHPGAFMVDEDPAARAAIERIFPESRVHFCDFHLWRAWKSRLAALRLDLTPNLKDLLSGMRLGVHEEAFNANLAALRQHFANSVNGQKFLDYLSHNYLFRKKYWAGYLRFFPQPTNNRLKTNHLRRRSRSRIDQYPTLSDWNHLVTIL